MTALVIALAGGGSVHTSQTPAPTYCPVGSRPAGVGCIDLHPVSITYRACSARRAVKFYAGRIAYWRSKMGAGTSLADGDTEAKAACPRYLAYVLQRKAYALRRHFQEWWSYNFAWWEWLPSNWRRLGACETGYGHEPGDWTWDSGTYVSAFGIYRAAYADDAHRIGNLSWDETIRELHRLPTPREQFLAALSHLHANGDGWGCPGP